MHLFCNIVHIGRSKLSKVADFGTNQKRVCDFLLVINSNFGPVLHRFWDTATYWLKIAIQYNTIQYNLRLIKVVITQLHNKNFSYPTLIKHPRSGWTLLNFWMNFLSRKLESIRRWRFRDPSLRHFHWVPACDRRTDRQTDRRTTRS